MSARADVIATPADIEIVVASEARALISALLDTTQDPAHGLRALRAHALRPAVIEPIVRRCAPGLAASTEWQRALEADVDRVRRVRRAMEVTGYALEGLEDRVALASSALGDGWGRDLDILVAPGDRPLAERRLRDAGFLELDPLLRRLGRGDAPFSSFAAIERGELLASVELLASFPGSASALRNAIGRAHDDGPLRRLHELDLLLRRAARAAAAARVTVRDALELLALLQRQPVTDPPRSVAVAILRCAALERKLGQPGPLTARAASLPSSAARSAAFGSARWAVAAMGRRLARVRPGPGLRVGFSGIDGAGKSTQAELLAAALARADIPARIVWSRLGSGGSLLGRLTRLRRRLLPRTGHSAALARAAGSQVSELPTRRGVLGWVWALVVALCYLLCVRRQRRPRRGEVLIYDRALVDALVGLELGYGGAVDLSVQRLLVRMAAPRPDLTFYLRVDSDTALRRKVDIFARAVLDEYVRTYEACTEGRETVMTIDSTRDALHTHRDVLEALVRECR
jgi:thymidylate kinase